jgi:hypothetical protein
MTDLVFGVRSVDRLTSRERISSNPGTVVEDESDAFGQVREAVMELSEPRTADEIAIGTDVHRRIVDLCLTEMVEERSAMSFGDRSDAVYYPDPIARYLRVVGDAIGPVDEDRLRSIRRDVADWWDVSSVTSTDELDRYCRAARLVASSRLPAGQHVYDADWDVLVVLDTCRVDALRAVADEFDLLDQRAIESRTSPGSQTAEWLSQTFTTDRAEQISTTGYVSGNGWVTAVFEEGLRPDDDLDFDATGIPTRWDVVDADRFAAVVDAWREGPGEYSLDTPWDPHPSPQTVTDHAIGLARQRDLDRLVVHYKQPHAPYTERARREGRTELKLPEASPRGFLESGGDPEVVWDCYLADLRAALESVEVLCRNVDGRVAITADHGEAFGERGGVGHQPAMLNPHVKRVPWTTVTGTDEKTREGDLRAGESGANARDVGNQLRALGYGDVTRERTTRERTDTGTRDERPSERNERPSDEPKITVLTVTNRPGGLDVLKHDLRRQTVDDFELVLVDDRHEQRKEAAIDYMSEFDLTYVEPREPSGIDVWNLNKAYNDGIGASEGELIVSLQDYIWIPDDGLERFWRLYEHTEGFVTGVGHKYARPSEAADLDGDVTIFEAEFDGKPSDLVERDTRTRAEMQLFETDYSNFELNWGAFPRGAAYAIGGFDERMDRVYSGDNLQFAYRASLAGYSFFLDQTNECRGFYHQNWFEYPDDWEENHFNNRPRLDRYDDGYFLDYL